MAINKETFLRGLDKAIETQQIVSAINDNYATIIFHYGDVSDYILICYETNEQYKELAKMLNCDAAKLKADQVVFHNGIPWKSNKDAFQSSQQMITEQLISKIEDAYRDFENIASKKDFPCTIMTNSIAVTFMDLSAEDVLKNLVPEDLHSTVTVNSFTDSIFRFEYKGKEITLYCLSEEEKDEDN